MNTKTLYIFRHGQTDWNKQRKLQGHTDIPLNEEGTQQAVALTHFFKKNTPDLVFSSPLNRAIKTAQLATGVNDPIIIKDLIEINLGDAEGVQEAELLRNYGEAFLSRWRSFHPHDRDFSYPNAESKLDATIRLNNALLKIANEFHFKSAAICSHGFVLRRLLHMLKEHEMGETYIPTAEEFPLVPNCKVYVLEYSSEKGLIWKKGPIDSV